MKYIFLPLILLSFFYIPQLTQAIEIGDIEVQENIGAQIILDASPQYPTPGENVTVQFSTFGTSINESTLRWYNNGILFDSEKTQINVTLGASPVSIRVTAQDTKGTFISKTITITPSDISFLIYADGSTPPFYQGATEVVKEGTVLIYAFPELQTTYSDSSLQYIWRVNGSVATQNTLAKNVFSYTGGLITIPVDIELEIVDPNGETLAKKETTLSFKNTPHTYFYENNPLYGILFNNTLTNIFSVESEEIIIHATPYFFSNETPLSYNWKINSQNINETGQDVTLRKTDDTSGTSNLSLEIRHPNNILQTSIQNISLNF